MKETMLAAASVPQPEETASSEPGSQGHLVKLERTVAQWMKSEWFANWVKLAHQPRQDTDF